MGAKRLIEYLQRAQPPLPEDADVSSGGSIDPAERAVGSEVRIHTPAVQESESTDSTYIDLDAQSSPTPTAARPSPLQHTPEAPSIPHLSTPSRKMPAAAAVQTDDRFPCLEMDPVTNTLMESTCILSSEDSWEVLPPTPQPARECTEDLTGGAMEDPGCLEESPECDFTTGSPHRRPFSSPCHSRGHRAIHAQTPEMRARKREKAQLLREERRQHRLERLQAMIQEFTPHTTGGDSTEQTEGQKQAGSREAIGLPMEAEAMLHLSDLYEQKIDTVSAQYEARIAVLEAQLHSLQHAEAEERYGEVDGNFDWDQEIEFTAPPGTRGVSRYAGLEQQEGALGEGVLHPTPRRRRAHKRSPSGGSKHQYDAPALSEETTIPTATHPETSNSETLEDHSPRQRSSSSGSGRRSPEDKAARRLAKQLHRQQQWHTLNEDTCTINNDSVLAGKLSVMMHIIVAYIDIVYYVYFYRSQYNHFDPF